MDRVATWPADDRQALFEDASERLPHLLPALVEKDFWVCFLLRRLFLMDHEVPMIFKGGTSISKAYPVINRFSEDIDISLDRGSLGYGDDRWDADTSGKAFRRLLEGLGQACTAYVHGDLLQRLGDDISTVLGPMGAARDAQGWHLGADVDGRSDSASLVFIYPRTGVTLTAGSYAAPNVLLEFGARADHWPEETRMVAAYAAQAFPELFAVGEFPVRTLEIARTFWEKATLLHSLACGGADRVRERMARHYYDLALLAEAPACAHAAIQVDLLEAVALHKERFFAARWASYPTARPGSLRLVPPPDVQKKLKSDYRDMAGLFMKEPPTFEKVIAVLARLEQSINGRA